MGTKISLRGDTLVCHPAFRGFSSQRFCSLPARANLITDPGFESCTEDLGDAPGWTTTNNPPCFNFGGHSGSWGALFAGSESTVSQTITTIIGDNYDFSFWLRGSNSSDSFAASFGSDEVLDLVDPGSFAYTLEDFTVTGRDKHGD